MCLVNDQECVPGRLRRKLCRRHYMRLMRTGSTQAPVLRDNLTNYIVDENGCHIWQGATYPDSGYGRTSRKINGTETAHIALWIEKHGPVAGGLDLDHLCRVHLCVNDEHLEPVTRAENLRRGHLARSMCKSGRHDITLPGALKDGTLLCYRCLQGNWARSREHIKQDRG